MTVEQNIKAVAELNYPRDRVEAETERLLGELHIDHLRHAPATALSGGERRRVEIARALAGRPSFILLDEPFAGIDPLAIADIRSVIRYLAGQGIGVLITDHNVRETLDITDRVSIISGGAVLFEGTADEAVNDPEVRRVYLGENYI
jgi:lipopolysaccharide export system ATP-binding protein